MKCPRCYHELPKMGKEEFEEIKTQLFNDAGFMRQLGQAAAARYLAEGRLDEILRQNGWRKTYNNSVC